MRKRLIFSAVAASAIAFSGAVPSAVASWPGTITAADITGDRAFARTDATPEAIIASWFEALRSGDSAKALELIDPKIPSAERALLTDRVLEGSAELKNVVVAGIGGSASSAPNHREFTASYEVNGAVVSTVFAADLASSGWIVGGGYSSIDLPEGVVVNGIPGSGDDGSSFTVFPGAYAVTAAVSTT